MNIRVPIFLQQEFEEYMKSNDEALPFKKQNTKKQFVQTFNKFYCTLYQKIIVDSNNSPTNISIQSFRKIANNNNKVYFILNFFNNKNYIVPVLTTNGNKSYGVGRGSYYKFTDQFLKEINEAQGFIDIEANKFVEEQDQQYKVEVEAESEKLLRATFTNQKRINEIKYCMNNLKQLRFICDQNTDQVNLTKKRYNSNIVKFNYRIYSPFSGTKKHYIYMGCVVDQNNNSINELYDLQASGIQMLQLIMKKKIDDCGQEIKWLEGLFAGGDFYTALCEEQLGWKYKRDYYKNMVQWFINSNPAFKLEFLKNGCCKEKNANENAIMSLFNQNTPKLFKFLAEYETYVDRGKTKSAIWKLIHKTETIVVTHLVPVIEKEIGTKIYTKHDSVNCDERYCTKENEQIVQDIWKQYKYKQLFDKKEVKQHEVFNEEDHITIDKLFDYYQNYYCMGRVAAPILKGQTQVLWREFNNKVFKPVWDNIDCGNILEGRRLEGEDWQSRRDAAKDLINSTIKKAIKCLENIQEKYGNNVFKDIMLVLFQSNKEILFFNKEE